jgi:uncharacterized protein (TIGR00730 family)
MSDSNVRKILVFCGSVDGSDPAYAETAEQLGAALGAGGYEVIYGGGFQGLMGRMARAASAAGARVTGILPQYFRKDTLEPAPPGYQERVVENLMMRKSDMLFHADMAVVLPGGLGTLDELWEVVEAQDIRFIAAPDEPVQPLVVVNVNGFFDATITQIDKAHEAGFVRHGRRDLVHFVATAQVAMEVIDSYRASGRPQAGAFYEQVKARRKSAQD